MAAFSVVPTCRFLLRTKHLVMDQSFSDSDITMSPSQILERLQLLRQLQILQRSKLKKQMNFTDSPEITSITEIVSHFSNSTSYNTFRSLLQSPQANVSKQSNVSKTSPRENLEDVIDGVTLLNLSQESEFINDSPSSAQSFIPNNIAETKHNEGNVIREIIPTNQISLEEMPILSPKKDFETLILEKLRKDEKSNTSKESNKCVEFKSSEVNKNITKRPFLKRGEGMARFGISKRNLIIQNTNTLPWKKKDSKDKPNKQTKTTQSKKTNKNYLRAQIIVNNVDDDKDHSSETINKGITESNLNQPKSNINFKDQTYEPTHLSPLSKKDTHREIEQKQYKVSDKKHLIHKEKTWASVLSKEQNDLLAQLKQSDYYKNFISPTKSIVSDISCDDNVSKLRQEKELAEQNLFELLEKKVTHESFNFENSFFNRFLGRTALESSGESTPLVLKKCISNNPRLMNIAPSILSEHQDSHCNSETCECEDCSDTCSSVSCCCSCKTITNNNIKTQDDKGDLIDKTKKTVTKNDKINAQNESHNDTIVNKEASVDMAEMNAKLIATSELLKERLKELEDEIEIFRQENVNLTKMREEVETERQKFFEEKQEYEKKFNEEKILSEYYLAEEKEKLQKQKQIYDRYIRDIRGKINKKEKDEVSNLKKEIQELKEEIRIKDAKSTSALARLRNQIKIMEKEKKNYVEEMENLKKENRRIKHSNDISRRLTNIKYLEQINKKLTDMGTKNAQSNITLDPDIKYKAHAIERQSRARTVQPITKNTIRPRAKSVPNLKVTSRYAKYFSQKDTSSDMDKYKVINDCNYASSNDESDSDMIQEFDLSKERKYSRNLSASDEDNLEKIYNERFKANAVSEYCKQKMSSNLDTADELVNEQMSNYFLSKNTDDNNEHMRSMSSINVSMNQKESPSIGTNSKSPTHFANYSTSSGISTNMSGNISHTNDTKNYTKFRHDKDLNKSPTYSNHSSISHKPATEASKFNNRMTPSPEPTTSTMNVTKTNLNPTEILKPDGSKELRFPNGNIKTISSDGKYSKFIYYNGDIKENFYNEGRIKYFYSETKTIHTTHADGLEVLEFPDGQIEKRYKDGSSEIRLPNGSIRYFDPKNEYVREEWRFPDGAALTVSANGEQRIVFPNGQVEVHTKEHKRREFPDGTVKLIYNDGTSETRYSSGRVRIKDKQGNLIMDSAPS